MASGSQPPRATTDNPAVEYAVSPALNIPPSDKAKGGDANISPIQDSDTLRRNDSLQTVITLPPETDLAGVQRASLEKTALGESDDPFEYATPRTSTVYRARAKTALSLLGEEASLLRGIPMNSVLSSFASKLADTRKSSGDQLFFGDDLTYQLSHQVPALDIFLSHNWSVVRWKKFIALALYCNLQAATVAAFLCALLCFALQAADVLPLPITGLDWVEDKFDEKDRADAQVGVLTSLLTAPIFVITIFFKHDLFGWLRGSPLVFLDKVCIHQTDQKLKEAGILKLGAFLASSSRMVILYSDLYVTKLWTMYEVACYLTTHTTHLIEVVHISLAPLFFIILAMFYVGPLLYWIPMMPTILAFGLSYGSITLAYHILCRTGHKSLASTWHHLSTFQVRKTDCFAEADRPVVEGNIEAFLKSKDYVAMDASLEDTLQAFDELVQQVVLRVVKASLGTKPLPLKHLVILSCLTQLAGQLDVTSGLAQKYGVLHVKVWSLLLLDITRCIPLIACMAESQEWFMAQMLHLTGWQEGFWIITSWCVCAGTMTGASALINFVQAEAATSNAAMLAFAVLVAGSWAIFIIVCIWQSKIAEEKVPDSKPEVLLEARRSSVRTERLSRGGSNVGKVKDIDDNPKASSDEVAQGLRASAVSTESTGLVLDAPQLPNQPSNANDVAVLSSTHTAG